MLNGEEGTLLPLGKRTFSAEMNLEGIAPGFYALRAVATLAGDKAATSQEVIKVEAEEQVDADGGKTTVARVTIVDPATADLPEGMELESPASPAEDPAQGQEPAKKG